MKLIKKLALLLLLAGVFTSQADAKLINFGIKAGMNVNKLSFNKDFAKDLISNSNATGWEAGVMADLNLPIIGLGFDVSLMYARMNNSSQAYFVDNADPNDDYVFNGKNAGRNFLMLPINVKYKFSIPAVSSFFAPFIFTGPDFAFKLDKNIVNSIKTKTCQVAWNVGLGIELVRHLQIAASYGFGISNIADKIVDVNAQQNANVKNNYWTVTAAWLF